MRSSGGDIVLAGPVTERITVFSRGSPMTRDSLLLNRGNAAMNRTRNSRANCGYDNCSGVLLMSAHDSLWAIVLAGGDGTRLAPLTRQLYGEPLPKQFAVLAGERSLLQATVDRLSPLVPFSRMAVVVPTAHTRRSPACSCAEYREVRVVTQPANRGTGPGILLPLAHVLEADPRARVVVAPSDHYVARPAALTAAIAAAATQADLAALMLVGIEPDHAETEYGWIEPGEVLGGGVRRVRGFVEKPSAERARQLFDLGCLWNSFVMVADGQRMWRAAETRMPVQAAVIRSCVASKGSKGSCLVRAYESMEDANFSRAVLEDGTDLGVVCARGCGFSDWGSPERVLSSLRGTADMERLMSRIASGDTRGPFSENTHLSASTPTLNRDTKRVGESLLLITKSDGTHHQEGSQT